MANPSPILDAQKEIANLLKRDGLTPDHIKPNDWDGVNPETGKPIPKLTNGDYRFVTEQTNHEDEPCRRVRVKAIAHKDGSVLGERTVPFLAGDGLVNIQDFR